MTRSTVAENEKKRLYEVTPLPVAVHTWREILFYFPAQSFNVVILSVLSDLEGPDWEQRSLVDTSGC